MSDSCVTVLCMPNARQFLREVVLVTRVLKLFNILDETDVADGVLGFWFWKDKFQPRWTDSRHFIFSGGYCRSKQKKNHQKMREKTFSRELIRCNFRGTNPYTSLDNTIHNKNRYWRFFLAQCRSKHTKRQSWQSSFSESKLFQWLSDRQFMGMAWAMNCPMNW